MQLTGNYLLLVESHDHSPSLSLAVHSAHTIPELLSAVFAETAKFNPSVVVFVNSVVVASTTSKSIEPWQFIEGKINNYLVILAIQST